MNQFTFTPVVRLLTVSIGLMTTSAFAVTAPDVGQVLQQLQKPLPPVAQVTPVPALSHETNTPESLLPSSDSAVRVNVTRLQFRGSTIYEQRFLNKIVGKLGSQDTGSEAVTLGDLRAAAQRITAYYRNHGYLLARAYLPPQDISSGVVTIAILEGRLDHIAVDNQSRLSSARIQALLEHQQAPDHPVRSHDANRALLLLQAVPGVGSVQGSLRPSAVVGSTDLNVVVTASPLITGSVSLDNSGNRYTGAERIIGGVNINNWTGIGDQISLQAVVTNEDRMDYGRAAWDAPVGSSGLRLGAAFSHLRYHLGDKFAVLDAHGTARTGALIGSFPILATPESHINVNLSLERRNLEDTTGLVALENQRSLDASLLTISGDFRDSALFTPAVNAWRVNITSGNLDLNTASIAAADKLTAKTSGQYSKVVTSFTREQLLPANFSVYLSGLAQRSGKNLDSSEQLTLGGSNGVRAYPEGEAPGDEGWIGTAELRYQLIPKLQLVAFYDIGSIKINHNPYIAQPNNRRLSGQGIGANTTWGPFGLKASLAWRGSEVPTSDSDRSPRVWVQAGYAF